MKHYNHYFHSLTHSPQGYMDIFQSEELPTPMTILQATAEVNNLAAQVNAFDYYNKEMDKVSFVCTCMFCVLHEYGHNYLVFLHCVFNFCCHAVLYNTCNMYYTNCMTTIVRILVTKQTNSCFTLFLISNGIMNIHVLMFGYWYIYIYIYVCT